MRRRRSISSSSGPARCLLDANFTGTFAYVYDGEDANGGWRWELSVRAETRLLCGGCSPRAHELLDWKEDPRVRLPDRESDALYARLAP